MEAFALRGAGREDELVAKWPVGGEEEMEAALGVGMKVAADGGVQLVGDVEAVLRALGEEVEMDQADRADLEAEKIEAYREAWGDEWKGVSLADPRIKFAVSCAALRVLYYYLPR